MTGIVSKVNFITTNAVDTILAVPRAMAPPEPNYLEKEDYGKVPKYLQQVRARKNGEKKKKRGTSYCCGMKARALTQPQP